MKKYKVSNWWFWRPVLIITQDADLTSKMFMHAVFMVLAAALKTWGTVQTSLSISLIEGIHPPCNMVPWPYISVLLFQLFTLVSSNLWFPFRLSISLSSSCPYCLPTFPHPQTFNSQNTCTLFVLIRYSSYAVHTLSYSMMSMPLWRLRVS